MIDDSRSIARLHNQHCSATTMKICLYIVKLVVTKEIQLATMKGKKVTNNIFKEL